MNKKQLISMWCGIGAIVLGIPFLWNECYVPPEVWGVSGSFSAKPAPIILYILWVCGISIVSRRLIITFKGKKQND